MSFWGNDLTTFIRMLRCAVLIAVLALTLTAGSSSAQEKPPTKSPANADHTTNSPSPPPDSDAITTARRTLMALKEAIRKDEEAGRTVDDLDIRFRMLDSNLSNKAQSPLQIAAEAADVTLQAVERFPDLPLKSENPRRPTNLRASNDHDQREGSSPLLQMLPLWLSTAAFVISVFTLIIIPFASRAAVKFSLRKAGLI